MTSQRTSGYISLRLIFLLPALLLLVVPIIHYVLIQQTLDKLSQNQRQQAAALLGTVNSIASADLNLLDHADAYKGEKRPLFVPQSRGDIDLDGRLTEWQTIEPTDYAGDDQIIETDFYSELSLKLSVRLQQSDEALFLFFDVQDDQVVYREISNISIHRNDHIRIASINQSGNFQRYTLATEQPGTVYGRVVSTGGRSLRREAKIEGFWRATDVGYQLEVKIDKSLTNTGIAFNVADIDQIPERRIESLIGNGVTDNKDGMSPIISRSATMEAFFLQLGLSQISFRDRYGNLIAGSTGLSDVEVLSQPLVVDDVEYGQFYLPLDSSEISAYRTQSYEQLYVLGIATLLIAVLFCWWLSSRVLSRLNKLGQAIETVVDDQGRVQGNLNHPIENDAIGDLTSRFITITERLQQYNEYLELLSRRLAHELRTPVSVVRSSLENLSLSVDDNQQKFVERANNGVARLTNILNSMSEASRLEHSLDKEEVVIFDLGKVVRGCFEGYVHAYPSQEFELIEADSELKVTGIPELYAQMLDKLIDNAEQFSELGQPIILRLSEEQDNAVLRVSNSGPELPDTLSNQLFEPMISVRGSSASEDSHLGLGLYVARLISQFHGGKIELRNREDRQGAIAIVTVPLLRITSKLA